MEDYWSIVPFPKGPDTEDYYYPVNYIRTTYLLANISKPKSMLARYSFLWLCCIRCFLGYVLPSLKRKEDKS